MKEKYSKINKRSRKNTKIVKYIYFKKKISTKNLYLRIVSTNYNLVIKLAQSNS